MTSRSSSSRPASDRPASGRASSRRRVVAGLAALSASSALALPFRPEREPVVSFTRNPVVALSSVTVSERHGDGSGYARSYSGNELRMEMSLKDGKPHGWQIVHPTTWQGNAVAGSRTCYQHGEAIKSTTCPTD